MSIFQNRTVAIAAGATILALAGSTGAVAANLVNSADIRDNSIRTVDVRDGSLRMKDLRPRVVTKFTKDSDSTFDDSELEEQIAALEARIVALESTDASGVNTNWMPNEGSRIDGPNSVTLTGGSTSVEIQNLDLPVQANDEVSFTYEGLYTAGSPRVFVEVDGIYHNSWDPAPAVPGVDNGDGTFTKTFTVPSNGRIGAAGVVSDNGDPGTVTVTNLVISGHTVSFQ